MTPCSRCISGDSECIYVASRRGYKGHKKHNNPNNPNKKRRHDTSPPPTSHGLGGAGDSCPMLLGAAPATPSSLPHSSVFSPTIVMPQTPQSPFVATPSMTHLQTYQPYSSGPPAVTSGIVVGSVDAAVVNLMLSLPVNGTATTTTAGHGHGHGHGHSNGHIHGNGHGYGNGHGNGILVGGAGPGGTSMPTRPAPLMPSMEDRCLDSFYRNFFASHPFVLPQEFLLDIAGASASKLDHLLAAIRYVGSLYLDYAGPARATFFEEALRLAYDPSTARDGFLVQTLLLLLTALDGSCQQEKARQLLADAERIAVQIALNTRPFATMHGRGVPVLEESWRRTWWDLFVVDGMVAGVHRQTNFLLFDVPADVALPCEEHQYISGVR